MKIRTVLMSGFLMVVLVFALFLGNYLPGKRVEKETINEEVLLLASEYSGSPFVEVNGNVPYFEAEEFTTESFTVMAEDSIILISLISDIPSGDSAVTLTLSSSLSIDA